MAKELYTARLSAMSDMGKEGIPYSVLAEEELNTIVTLLSDYVTEEVESLDIEV